MPAHPQEHVQNCRSSAQCAVASLLDPSTPAYNYLPYFYSRVFNLSWQVRASVPAASRLPGCRVMQCLLLHATRGSHPKCPFLLHSLITGLAEWVFCREMKHIVMDANERHHMAAVM